TGRLPREREPRMEVLAHGEPGGQRLGRPQPDLHLSTRGSVRHGGSVIFTPQTRTILRHAAALPMLMLAGTLSAQGAAKAQACFFSEDFSNGLPAGWDIGPAVERQTADGTGLGEFVPAWIVGTASEANANGFFPVP